MVPVVVPVLVLVVRSLLSQISQSLFLSHTCFTPHIILILSPLIYGHSLQADDISYIVVYDGMSNLKGYDWQDRSEWYDDDITRIHLPSLPSFAIINNIVHCPVNKIIHHCHCRMVQIFLKVGVVKCCFDSLTEDRVCAFANPGKLKI